jgi:hypothetical protein
MNNGILLNLHFSLSIIFVSSQSTLYIAAAIETASLNNSTHVSLMLQDEEFIVGLDLAFFMAFVCIDRQQ